MSMKIPGKNQSDRQATMVGNIIKFLAALVIGCIVGWILGAALGSFLGAIPALFFYEIVAANQEILFSALMSLIMGGLLGFVAVQFINKFMGASEKPFLGIALGVIVGFVVVIFMTGLIDFPNGQTVDSSESLYLVIYGGMIGGDIGLIIFPVLGGIKTLRDFVEGAKEMERNKERMEQIKKSLGVGSSNKENYL